MENFSELQEYLTNQDEPLSKRLNLADNAFTTPDLPISYRESLIIKWALSISKEECTETEDDIWELIIKWLSSDQFQNLTVNEFMLDDISVILKQFKKKLEDIPEDNEIAKNQILNSASLLLGHKVFCHYFKYNLKCYFKFLSAILSVTDSTIAFIEFIKTPFLIPKNFVEQEKYVKYFYKHLFVILAQSITRFNHDRNLLEEVTTAVYKCLFQENAKHIERFFLSDYNEKIDNKIVEETFKYLMTVSTQNLPLAISIFKLIVTALCKCSNNSNLCYKLLIYLLQLINFDLSNDFKQIEIFKRESADLTLSVSLELLSVCLDILSEKHFVECEISGITFTDFLRKIIKLLIILQIPSKIVYEIIIKCVKISPLSIESIANDVIIFAMFANNENQMEEYENLIIEIFRIYAKLHRTENFLAKLIPLALRPALEGHYVIQDIEKIYSINSNVDIEKTNPNDVNICVCSTLTEKILKTFSNSIIELTSWQIINVMKTFLFHLKVASADFSENNKEDTKFLVYLEILGTLISQFLQTVRIADHTLPTSVVDKFIPCLDELTNILKILQAAILKRPHNHITMRTFLNISHRWTQIYITIRFYSFYQVADLEKMNGNTHVAIGIPNFNLHMTNRKWKLIIQRITNFGQHQCKILLHKLYIQRLKGICLFETDNEKSIEMCITTIFKTRIVDIWNELLSDKLSVDFLIPKLHISSLLLLTEHIIENELFEEPYINDSVTLISAIIYVTISKINKYLRPKRKLDEERKMALCSEFFRGVPIECFFNNKTELQETNKILKTLYETVNNSDNSYNFDGSENRQKALQKYLQLFRIFPIVYSTELVQKISLMYLYFLYKDLINASEDLKKHCEDIIIGLLQYCKYNLFDVFDLKLLCLTTVENFRRFNMSFSLIVDNLFKCEDAIKTFKLFIECLDGKLNEPKYLDASLIIVQAANKIKKTKMSPTSKQLANEYKETVLNQLSEVVCQSYYFVEAYAVCLKHYSSNKNNPAVLEKLLSKLPAYIDYATKNLSVYNESGSMALFMIILNKKQQLQLTDQTIIYIWNACKTIRIKDEYVSLIMLIVTLVPNEQYELILNDLVISTKQSITDKNYETLQSQLKIWISILTCDVNPVKMEKCHDALIKCVDALLEIIKDRNCSEELLKTIVHLEESAIETQHHTLLPPLIDMFLTSVTIIMQTELENFEAKYNLSMSVLEKLLKHRPALILDRLPLFQLQYRILLKELCSNANPNSNSIDADRGSDCAHRLEKLTTNLISYKRDCSRIAVFIISDILGQYEQICLYPNVKIHLNNCIYNLISLCDNHSVSYLMRTLSRASTEMFKTYYEHYKKYYKYTGKI